MQDIAKTQLAYRTCHDFYDTPMRETARRYQTMF